MSAQEVIAPTATNKEGGHSEAASAFEGIWKTVESADFEDFLKAIDVGITWRVLSSGSKPSIEFCVNGDEWTLKTHTLLNTHEIKFTLGKEFLETRLDGVRVKTTITLENGKLVQRSHGDKDITTVRELEGNDKMKSTFTCNDVKAVRVYQRTKQVTR